MCQTQDLPWYQTWFNKDYLEVYGHRDETEARQAVSLAERELGLSPGDQVLDLCCGNGRHSLHLARRGFKVVSLDLSYALLQSGAERARQEALRVAFVQADARQIALRAAFDAVLNFFTSFGYFDADRENVRVLENISRVLTKRGRFLIDYFNTEQLLRNLVPETVSQVGSSKVREMRRIDASSNMIAKTITIERDGVEKRYVETVKLYREHDFRDMLGSCGLAITKTFGDYDGAPAALTRPRLILIGGKA